MDEELLLQMLSDPQMADQLANMGVYGDRQTLLGQQAKRGMGLFETPNAQGRDVGHTYVASSPLEHLGVAVQRGLGAKMMGDATKQQRDLVAGDVAARKAFAGGLGSVMADAMRARRAQSVGTPPNPGEIAPDFYQAPREE